MPLLTSLEHSVSWPGKAAQGRRALTHFESAEYAPSYCGTYQFRFRNLHPLRIGNLEPARVTAKLHWPAISRRRICLWPGLFDQQRPYVLRLPSIRQNSVPADHPRPYRLAGTLEQYESSRTVLLPDFLDEIMAGKILRTGRSDRSARPNRPRPFRG